MDIERLAQRLYDLVPTWERDDTTIKDIVNMLENDPLYFIEWLTDYINES